MSQEVPLESTLSAFYRWEQQRADEVFLRQPFDNDWKEYNWSEVGQQVRKMATHLKQSLPENSKVAILSLNCAHWFMADLAIMMAGHISVPIYPTAGKDTIATILEHSEAELLFVGKLWDWPAKQEAIDDSLKKIGFFHQYEEFASWDQVVAQSEPMSESPVPDLSEIASIIYTSGTTGMPKGVMIDYMAFANGAKAAIEYVDMQKEHFFSYLPLAHCAERELVEIISIHSGSVVSFTESLDTFQQNILDVKPTIFLGVPRIWLKFQQGIEAKVGKVKLAILLKIPLIGKLLKKKIIAGLGLDKVKVALSGAAALPAGTLAFFEKLGLNICEAYGLTESMAFGTANIPQARAAGSVGLAIKSGEVKIAEASGEVLLKSPCIMQGYYKEPLKTEKVLTEEGYLKTGDLGTFDEQGFLNITGRVKDIFKTSKGKYVSPIPIEAKLEPELGVDNLCVIGDGLPSPVAVASVYGKTLNDQTAYVKEAEVLLQKINGCLEKHEKLSHILLVGDEWSPDNGLITPTLKIRRPQLEERYKDLIEKHRKSPQKVIWVS
ncbi:AMP-binding protein [Kangiella sp. TOML190]|uniref:AMP-binding protein n=1 Tax=Kangiella sp. TOML190 TaxID=2931351 RepID=UPI00204172FF|nr:AMP-binding protein [Kangiella sp. TOML190]